MLNLSRDDVVCEHLTVADRPLRRLRGLLGRASLPVGEAMLLAPAPSVHTAFMRFPIDVVFMDSTLRVVKVVERLAPWRAASAHRARAVLELPTGEIERRRIAVGDQLGVIEVGGYPVAVSTSIGRRDQPRAALLDPGTSRDAHAPHSSPAESTAPVLARGTASGTRVLLVCGDRRFRATAAALLTRRGCSVSVGDSADSLTELARAHRAEVLVLETGHADIASSRELAQVRVLHPPVGVVLVAGDEVEREPSTVPIHTKWDSFEDLYAAIECARPNTIQVTS